MWLRSEVLETVRAQFAANPLQTVHLVAKSAEPISAQLREALPKANVTFGPINSAAKPQSVDLVIFHKILFTVETSDENLKAALKALKPNGVVVIIESLESISTKTTADLSAAFDWSSDGRCIQSGSVDYTLKFNSMTQFEESKGKTAFFWILSKELNDFDENDEKMTRSFLDKTQYTDENIVAYEWIFGKDFISPGGIDENRKVLSAFDGLTAGKRMLDIGCGIGGGPRQVAREFGVEVLAVDISANMMAYALERGQREPDSRVRYQLADAVQFRFPAESFDFVFSRDCIQHIAELPKLFENIYRCVKPGGQVLITMYGKGKGTLSEEFLEYVRDRKYDLHSLDEFLKMAKSAGFRSVEGENMTPRFAEILRNERENAQTHRAEFLEKFSEKKLNGLLESWEQKLRFIRDDNHNWLKIKLIK